MKTPIIKEMLGNGEDVIEISKKAKVSSVYVKLVRGCLRKGVSPAFYQKRFLARNPEIRNRDRKKNYDRGAIYDFRSHKIYKDEEKKLIMRYHGTDRELAKIIHRSVKAIQAKRVKLKKESELIVEDVFKSAVKEFDSVLNV